jgi:hypothetical protein
MNRTIASLFVMAVVSPALVACEKPGQAEKRAETTAHQELANARTEAEQQAQNAQAAANRDIAAAKTTFAKAREEYVHERRLELIALDSHILDLESKARSATGKAKVDIESRLPAIRAQREAFLKHLEALEAEVATTWDADKASLEKEWDSLKSAVDKLG